MLRGEYSQETLLPSRVFVHMDCICEDWHASEDSVRHSFEQPGSSPSVEFLGQAEKNALQASGCSRADRNPCTSHASCGRARKGAVRRLVDVVNRRLDLKVAQSFTVALR